MGIGHVTTQLAVTAGSTALVTAAPQNHPAVKRLGADAVFDYGSDDLETKVHNAASGGINLIMDHIFGEIIFPKTLSSSRTRCVSCTLPREKERTLG